MTVLPKAVHNFNIIPIKISKSFFTEVEKNYKIYMDWKKSLNSENNKQQQQQKVGGITLPNFKLYYKTIVTNIWWYWYKNRYIGQWNRKENPGIRPHTYKQLVFVRVNKHKQWGKNTLLVNGAGKTGYQKSETGLLLLTMYKN